MSWSLLSLLLMTPPVPLQGVCEASAAVVLPDGRVLVADNERHKELYLFRVGQDQRLHAVGTLGMPDDDRPRDIEALGLWGRDLAVVGSHSTKKHCEASPKRARIRALTLGPDDVLTPLRSVDGRPVLDAIRASTAACQRTLFTAPAPPAARAVCQAMREQACPGLDTEGAILDPDGRLWLGLRRPVVGGRAVLARVAPGDTLRFDAVVWLDLGGHGVRELVATLAPDRAYVVAGPVTDGGGPHALYAFDPRPLRGKNPLRLEKLGALPASTEAYVPLSKTSGIALTDGDGDQWPCKEKSAQHLVDFSPPAPPVKSTPPAPGPGTKKKRP